MRNRLAHHPCRRRFNQSLSTQLVPALSRAFFFLEKRMPNWRNEYRRFDNCRSGYRPQREVQSYCSRDCRRAAAYGRERCNAGTVGRRRRRLEASDPRIPIAGSVRNGVFASIETIPCKPTKPTYLGTFDDWPRCKVCKRWKMLPRDGLPRHMFCIALRKRT